jgi:hypothetical protein
MEYSGAEGKLIHKKNQKQKISWHCPFNDKRILLRSQFLGHRLTDWVCVCDRYYSSNVNFPFPQKVRPECGWSYFYL